jgi:hypothetical protein
VAVISPTTTPTSGPDLTCGGPPGYSESALGAFYRRIRAQKGSAIANVATAHKLARLIYFMLNNRSDYQDPGADAYNEQYRQRVIKNLQHRAKKLGFELVPAAA